MSIDIAGSYPGAWKPAEAMDLQHQLKPGLVPNFYWCCRLPYWNMRTGKRYKSAISVDNLVPGYLENSRWLVRSRKPRRFSDTSVLKNHERSKIFSLCGLENSRGAILQGPLKIACGYRIPSSISSLRPPHWEWTYEITVLTYGFMGYRILQTKL